MREDLNGGKYPPQDRHNGYYDRLEGHSDPLGRREVIKAAHALYCSICDANPCYLLTAAAMSALHEQLTENDTYDPTNLISAVHYMQSLERLQGCLSRHIEVTRNAWKLDEHFRVSERALCELERQRHEAGKRQTILRQETKDPPNSLN